MAVLGSLLLLHGEQVLIGVVFAGVTVLVGLPVLLYFWLWHTKLSELKLAFIFLSIVALLCLVFLLDQSDPASILGFTLFSIGFLLTLPWNLLGSWMLGAVRNSPVSDPEFAVIMMCSALVNAVLLYFAALKLRRLVK